MGLFAQLKSLFRSPGRRPWWDQPEPSWPAHHPTVELVVDNRVLLLGLDHMYREAMKLHESTELLDCAAEVAARLGVSEADVPIEGYYSETADLRRYFRLLRALQQVPLTRETEVAALQPFTRLLAVTSSPIYGVAVRQRLLPVGRDPLSQALRGIHYTAWTVPALLPAAAQVARETDDYSLVGLAVRAEDPVTVAAVRESVVLYADCVTLGSTAMPPRQIYRWIVAAELARAAGRFVEAYNGLFGRELPPPEPRFADAYFRSSTQNDVVGRCVRLGGTIPPLPVRHYHWAIVGGADGGLAVREFWDDVAWTTATYRHGTMGRTDWKRSPYSNPQ